MGYAAYVVATGKRPGVYESWLDASWQIKGMKDARWKGYDTIAEAEAAWLDQRKKGYVESVPLPNDNSENTDNEEVPFIPDGARAARERANGRMRTSADSTPPRSSPAPNNQAPASPRAQTQSQRTQMSRRDRRADEDEYTAHLNEVVTNADSLSLSGAARNRTGPADNVPQNGTRNRRSPVADWGHTQGHRGSNNSRREDREGAVVTRSRQSSVTSGPDPDSLNSNHEDGQSPLIHRRRRERERLEPTSFMLHGQLYRIEPIPDQPSDRSEPPRQNHSRDRRSTSRSDTGYDTPRSSISSSSSSVRSAGSRAVVVRSQPGSARHSVHSPETRHSHSHDIAPTAPEPLVPTRPNTPVSVTAPLRPGLTGRPEPHTHAVDACIPGVLDVHHEWCPNFKRWLDGLKCPLQASFNPDRLARTRSEPAPSSSSSASRSGSRADRAEITSLSPHISVAGLQREYSAGPAGATPPSSPRSPPSRVRPESANVLGLSPRSVQRPVTVLVRSEDPRSPILRGTPVPASVSSSPQSHRPSPDIQSIESRLVASA